VCAFSMSQFDANPLDFLTGLLSSAETTNQDRSLKCMAFMKNVRQSMAMLQSGRLVARFSISSL